MARSVYLTAVEPGSGKSAVALGLMELFSRRVRRVGFFRPVVPAGDRRDNDIELIRRRYRLDQEYDESYAATAGELRAMSDRASYDTLLKRILESYKRLDARSDAVLVEGTDFGEASRALEFDFNADLANHLGTPVLLVVRGSGRSADEVLDATRLAHGSFEGRGATILATICNRVEPGVIEEVRRRLPEVVDDEPAYALPEDPMLATPTVAEVAETLKASFLQPADGIESPGANREIRNILIGAMTLPNFLDRVGEGDLIVTPGDRADLIVGGLASRFAGTYPNVAGVVLTGGLIPEPAVLSLIEGLGGTSLPVLTVDRDTYATAAAVGTTRGLLRPDSELKIATALNMFEEHIDVGRLEQRIEVTRSSRVSPLMFEHTLIERARAGHKHIVLPEGGDDRILRAAEQLLQRGVARLTILGDEASILSRSADLGVALSGQPNLEIVDPLTTPLRDDFAATYYELRKHKGVAETLARDVMGDGSYFGTMMVYKGLADGMVSGAAHTTAHTIRPAFEFIRTAPGVSIVSSVFLMSMADRVLIYGDCAVVPNPNAEQLADIAVSSARTAVTFGIEPRVAMLSYSTGESGSGEDVDRVREATRLAREKAPELPIEGPIQYDAAVDADVARTKLPGSAVAGRATVFVFPDLNTGNNTYKAVQRSAGAVAIGPVLQGLRKPVNDLSRGALVADIVNTVAITAIQAAEEGGA
jgi:phosphate acetyltransferase